MKTSTRVIQWIARILCILAILFISLFALDSFSSERTFWHNIGAFMVHLIPSFILLAILKVAWNREKIGGIILITAAVAFGVFVFNINYNQRHFTLLQSIINVSIVSLPFVIAGILFIASHIRKSKELTKITKKE